MSSSSNDLFSAFHSLPPISKATCRAAFQHNPTGEWLSLLIVVGLVVSYLPQHYRIIHSRNSEGFSALFLLLGATSSASSLANIVTLQWGQIACCQYLSGGQCFESVLGIAQVFVQWFCFNLIFVLYLIYYPLSSKYVRSVPIATSSLPHSHRKPQPFLSSLVPDFMRSTDREVRIRPSASSESLTSTAASDDSDDEEAFAGSRIGGTGRFDPRSFLLPGQIARGEIVTSTEFRHALYLFFLTCLHFVLTFLTTFILIITLPGAETPHAPSPPGVPAPPGGGHGKEHPQERAVRVWAATLGWVSLGLACVQYAPQLVLTARKRLVGSLSVPMMILQTPGSFLFVYTLAIRPSVTYTAWITYFVTGLLQGSLLVLCLMWKRRQASLGIDDWGRKVDLEDGGEGEAGREAEGERRRLLE